MKTLGYYNGQVAELEDMQVPMLDRACYFGDGVYDVTYSRNYHIFALSEHIENLYQSAGRVGIAPLISKNELAGLAQKLIKKMDTGNLWIYLQFSRGTGIRSHVCPPFTTPNLWIMMRPGQIRELSEPMDCITAQDTRHYYCNVKSLNLLSNILAKQKATYLGADEAILHRRNTVTECSHSNISILKNGVLITHPANDWIYAGTGRAHLIQKCKELDFPVLERAFTIRELFTADEVLITSATALCAQVRTIDETPVGGKAKQEVEKLQQALLYDFLSQTE